MRACVRACVRACGRGQDLLFAIHTCDHLLDPRVKEGNITNTLATPQHWLELHLPLLAMIASVFVCHKFNCDDTQATYCEGE